MFKAITTGVVITASFATLISLGNWQVERLQWKTNLLEQIAVYQGVDITQTRLDLSQPQPDFKRGYIDGAFNPNQTIRICPRTDDGAVGCHVYSPIRTATGLSVIVNLGWIERDTPITYPDLTPGRFGGYLMTPEDKGLFTPSNRPAQDLWYWADIAAIKNHFNIERDVHGQILYLEAPYKVGNIKPFDGAPQPRNKHFQYAVFWYGMAVVLTALLGFSWWRNRR